MGEHDWKREMRLTRFVRAAGWQKSSVFIEEMPPGHEGAHNFTNGVPEAFVSSSLSEADAEATVLHELAHVELRHDDDRAYLAARLKDEAAGVDVHRGPWEIEADNLAAAFVQELGGLLFDGVASMRCLEADAARFSRK